ncbi:MAG TPA: response regulator [Longimicrobiales bacterium]
MATPLRILIAEDEALNALALRSQLEALGHCIVGPARNGREAVDLVTRQAVDLAILDIRMPELTGLEAAEQIVRTRPIPIILLTGFGEPELASLAASAPVFHYLVKPISLEDLVPAIGVACSRFKEWQAFRADAERLRRKIEDRQLLDRAKAVLMEVQGLSEHDAYRLLQQESQRRSLPMVEIARNLLMADSVLRDTTAL